MKVKKHYEDGSYYEGEVNAAGEAEGYGICRYSNGIEYRGHFKANMWDGDGEYTTPNGWRFTGRFKEGYFHDFFRIVKPDGTVIMGMFSMGYINEQGEIVGMQRASISYTDGFAYEGEVDGFLARHGNGTLTTATGFVIEGQFENDLVCGMVTIRQPGGPVMRGTMYGKNFQGTWTLDWMDDGTHMTADFKDGYMDPDGCLHGIQSAVITYKNGDVYTGRLNPQLKFHGYGTLRKRDGVIEAGIWEYGRLVQKDKSNSRSYSEALRSGASADSRTKPQTVLWTILENSSYHCLLIYSGDDTSGTPLYRIETSEINKVFAGSQPYTFIRDYQSGDIVYTVVRESIHGVFHVRTGNNPHLGLHADVRYTIRGNYIAIGEDNLMNHITYRIRDLGYKKIVEYY